MKLTGQYLNTSHQNALKSYALRNHEIVQQVTGGQQLLSASTCSEVSAHCWFTANIYDKFTIIYIVSVWYI